MVQFSNWNVYWYILFGSKDEQVHNITNLYVEFTLYSYDPTLTYGKAKDAPKPIELPHFVKLDRKCLSFNGYTQHTITNSPIETFRVRKVKITYFLVDDTIAVVEPVVKVNFYLYYFLNTIILFFSNELPTKLYI